MNSFKLEIAALNSKEAFCNHSKQKISSVIPLTPFGLNIETRSLESDQLIFRQARTLHPTIISGTFRDGFICFFVYRDLLTLGRDLYRKGNTVIGMAGDDFSVRTTTGSMGRTIHLRQDILEHHLAATGIDCHSRNLKQNLHAVPLLEHLLFSAAFDALEVGGNKAAPVIDVDGFYHKLAMLLEARLVKTSGYRLVNKTRIFNKATEYIAGNLANKVSLADIASYCSCSARTLSYTFEYFLDCTVYEYVHSQKVLQTFMGIQNNPDRKISAIYDSLGVIARGRFSSEFRDIYGIKPVELRRLMATRDAGRPQ